MIVTLCFSIQRAAVWVLDRYYSDFPVYNPALLNLPKSILSKKMTGFKVYSLDGKYSLITALMIFVMWCVEVEVLRRLPLTLNVLILPENYLGVVF